MIDLSTLDFDLSSSSARVDSGLHPPPPPGAPPASAPPVASPPAAPSPAAARRSPLEDPPPAGVGAPTRAIDLRTIDFSVIAAPAPAAAPAPSPEPPATSASREALKKEVEALASKLEVRGAGAGEGSKLPSGELAFVKKGGQPAYRAKPVAPLDFKPSVLEKGAQLAGGGQGSTFAILGIAALLGFLWIVAGWVSPAPPPKRTGAVAEALRFHCVGNVFLPSSTSFSDVSLVVEFPQVPFRRSYAWSELSHPNPHAYDCAVDFKFTKLPGFFNVHVSKPGVKEVVSKQLAVPIEAGQIAVPDLYVKKGGS